MMGAEPDIGVRIKARAWRQIPGALASARRAAKAALEVGGGPPTAPFEVAIILADDATVRRLNLSFRGEDKATNVLAFPALDAVRAAGAPVLLGDVVLAAETVLGEAQRQGKPPAAHMSHLIVHGVLHLLGFDHHTDRDAGRMEAAEIRVLAGLNIGDPYGESVESRPRRP
jgi:probable rRNA maturation factor